MRTYAREGSVTWREWRRSLSGPRVRAIFSWADPGPGLVEGYRASLKQARVLLRR